MMLCLEIELNGSVICRPGIGEYGVLTAITTWVNRDPARHAHSDPRTPHEEELKLEVGGMSESAHLNWPSPQLKRGDVVTIRVMDCNTPDQPSDVIPIDRELKAKTERQYYEMLKSRYEPQDSGEK